MSFDQIKDHLKDVENIFEFIRDNVRDLKTQPIDLNENLHRENELLKEIEELKNSKKEELSCGNHDVRLNEEIITLKENHKNEINLLENRHNIEMIKCNEKIREMNEVIKGYKKEMLDLKGGVRVYCRVKPLLEGKNCDLLIDDSFIRLRKDKKENLFNFDRIFDCITSQQDVYQEIEGMVESIFDGYKTCLFAYGQTGSGKTYTMIGDIDNPGILNKALATITKNHTDYVNEGWMVDIKVSSIEIYNEEIYDLLGEHKNKINIIRSKGATILQNCTEIDINGLNLENIVHRGLIKRKMGGTLSNEQSSRSHAIFILKIRLEREGEMRNGSLCLIDLAGSERLDKSKSEGKRLKEAQNINKSLSCLGDVFMAILNKNSYVPFRNSKLTYFLQDYLSGNSRVSIVLNISQEEIHYHETLCTLRFGYKVSECKLGKVSRNILKQSYTN